VADAMFKLFVLINKKYVIMQGLNIQQAYNVAKG
jgi:hypothetical protein